MSRLFSHIIHRIQATPASNTLIRPRPSSRFEQTQNQLPAGYTTNQATSVAHTQYTPFDADSLSNAVRPDSNDNKHSITGDRTAQAIEKSYEPLHMNRRHNSINVEDERSSKDQHLLSANTLHSFIEDNTLSKHHNQQIDKPIADTHLFEVSSLQYRITQLKQAFAHSQSGSHHAALIDNTANILQPAAYHDATRLYAATEHDANTRSIKNPSQRHVSADDRTKTSLNRPTTDNAEALSQSEPPELQERSSNPQHATHNTNRINSRASALYTPKWIDELKQQLAQQYAAARHPSQTGTQPEPVVNVTIGRVEVRADKSTERKPLNTQQRHKDSVMSLDDYLKQRSKKHP